MSIDDRAPWRRRASRCLRGNVLAAAAVALSLTLAACSGGRGHVDKVADDRSAPNRGAIPTLPGGVELGSLDPSAVLVGTGLAFGSPLPGEQLAADGFKADPEVRGALARRAYVAADGRHLADVIVLDLDGHEVFDEDVLAAFERGVVSAVGGGTSSEVPVGGRTVLRAARSDGALVAVGFREANLLTIVSGPIDGDVQLTATSQIEARARGEIGAAAPLTPLVAVPVEAVLVAVPTVTFAPIPPPDEEVGPEVPALDGASGVQGRYGVVAGERRTVVWVFSLLSAAYPSAEALEPAMQGLAAARAGGKSPATIEVGGRVVYTASNDAGSPSAQVFRHQGLVVLVEGDRPDQVDAVVTAWIAALGPT